MIYARLMGMLSGYPSDVQKLADVGLGVGELYEVAHVRIGGWSSEVVLIDYVGVSFNTVNFEFVDADGNMISLLDLPSDIATNLYN